MGRMNRCKRLRMRKRKKGCLRDHTLVESRSTLRGRSVQVQKGRHNMQHIGDIGCLTQRSQLDRLQELADRITRERIKALQPSDLLATTVFVIGPSGKESTWELDHLAVARSEPPAPVQLLLAPEAGPENTAPAPGVQRVLREYRAAAAGPRAP